MSIAEAFEAISAEQASGYLQRYYGLGESAGQEFTGAHFDTFGSNDPDAITPDDLVAVSCLSVHVPSRAALAFLGSLSADITNLLKKIPADLSLEDAPFDKHDELLGSGSAPLLLWRLLRADVKTRWGVGPTTASKIMARKRPALIPIYDGVVGKAAGFRNSDGTWRAWHEEFATDAALMERLESLRSAAGLREISRLRILDVVLWMHGSQGTEGPESVDQEKV